jgi:hypothetical protein
VFTGKGDEGIKETERVFMITLTAQQISSFQALFLGFAFAGLLAQGFEMTTQRAASFRLLNGGIAALPFVPVLVFSGPFILMRNTIRGRRFERRKIRFVMAATILAGFWSMACGQLMIGTVKVFAG